LISLSPKEESPKEPETILLDIQHKKNTCPSRNSCDKTFYQRPHPQQQVESNQLETIHKLAIA
jgi:hypothetical protein